MEEIQLDLNEHKRGAFTYNIDDRAIGRMEVGIKDNDLAVYHTEVEPEAEGKGIAKKLLETMVNYARQHHMMVVPLCPYVHAQFQRHPNEYNDIWKRGL